jgi:hypothetical protein
LLEIDYEINLLLQLLHPNIEVIYKLPSDLDNVQLVMAIRMNDLGLFYHNLELCFRVLDLSDQGFYMYHKFLCLDITITSFRV